MAGIEWVEKVKPVCLKSSEERTVYAFNLETAFEQSRAEMRLEICRVFQIPLNLISFDNYESAYAQWAREVDAFTTAILFATEGGWRGDRRPQAW